MIALSCANVMKSPPATVLPLQMAIVWQLSVSILTRKAYISSTASFKIAGSLNNFFKLSPALNTLVPLPTVNRIASP